MMKRIVRTAVIVLLWCGAAPPVAIRGDEAARLVADIYPGVDPQVTSDPQGFVRIGDVVLFNAVDAAHGRELWRTDGTAEGTVLVEDIHPGEPWGVVAAYQGVAAAGDVAYFAADDGVHGAELWRSDGTSDGTQLVGDLNPGPASSDPAPLWVVGSMIYFVAHDAQAGVELWRSDGTAAGSARVVDINPGRGDAQPQFLGMFHGLMILIADDGVHGCELWATDGTAEGTRLVKDTNPSAACYERPPPGYPFLHDIYLGPRAFTDAGDVFFFTTDRALWKSDGSEAGTEPLYSFYGCSGFEVFRCPPTCLSVVDGVLYFQGDDYTAGRELWHSDGTPEGTAMIADLLATPCHMSSYGDDCSSMACNFAAGGDGVIFTARDTFSDYAQWTTDGTAEGTRKLGALPPPDGGPFPGAHPYPDPGVILNGALIYGAGELYRHDGGDAGPVLLKDIMQLPASSYPSWFVRAPSSLLFFADDGQHGRELWRSEATSGGAQLVGDIWPGADSSSATYPAYVRPIAFAGGAAFVANDGEHGAELWVSDGSTAGTHLVKDIAPGADAGAASSQAVTVGDTLFFVANDGAHGGALWRSDGTEAGTRLVRDINPLELTAVNDSLFFSALDGSGVRTLWQSDGTVQGTGQVGTVREPYGFTRFGPGVAFFASDPDSGRWSLWRSDGSDNGTVLVRSHFDAGEAPSGLTSAGGTLFFAANERGVVGQRTELWRSDGTAEGTNPLVELPADETTSYIGYSTLPVRNRLFFTVIDIPGGEQLWTSDGSPPGTVLVRQLNTGIPATFAHFLVAAGDVVFFTAVADGAGARLWRSDGSAAGTMPIAAVAPPLAVDPSTDAAILGRMLYFTADDGQSGSELWALPLTGLAPECRHDCDQDFTVDVSDLVRGVRIALGAARLDTCALMDADGDGAVAIDELIAAVGEALAGC